MSNIITTSRLNTGELILESEFSTPISLPNVGSESIIEVKNVPDLLSLDNLTTSITGENNTTSLKMYYRISMSSEPNMWSEWIEISPNGDSECFVEVTPFYDYNIQIKFVRSGSNTEGNLLVNSFKWEGSWNINMIDQPIVDISSGSNEIILDSNDTYKVFELTGYELVAKNVSKLDIQYRISQNSKRSWTKWTPLTSENIKTEKIDPIRFFNIQYKFSNTGSSTVQVRDLNLYGEFINVSENYQKVNLVGLRENCANGLVGNTGLNAGTGSNNLQLTNELKSSESVWSSIDKNNDDLFNPYKLGEAVDLFQKLSDDATQLGGWEVEYFRTDPDKNGIDHSIHEYSLHGVVDMGKPKILVPDNQFPSNQIAFNQFDLALFESFEVHLTKVEFKSIFGAQYRPSKQDFLYFCDLSRMYRVENAQAIRDFGNSSVYYKLILGKYNERSNVKPINSTIQSRVNEIVNNSTLEDLFGTQKSNDKKEVANKDQLETLSSNYERVRNEIIAPVEKELIDNAELVISKYHYNLSNVQTGGDAVVYKKSDLYLKEGGNRSFIAWFKLIDYSDSDTYTLLDNYNTDLSKGYKFVINNGNLITTINGSSYSLDVSNFLDDDIWFSVLINIDQRQREISHYLYKRNVDREVDAKNLNSTKLKLLSSSTQDYIPTSYELTNNDLIMKITGSFMRITNLRIFNDIIEESEHTKIINQQIVRDSDYIILADNANRIYVLPNYPYS